jgi:chitinase
VKWPYALAFLALSACRLPAVAAVSSGIAAGAPNGTPPPADVETVVADDDSRDSDTAYISDTSIYDQMVSDLSVSNSPVSDAPGSDSLAVDAASSDAATSDAPANGALVDDAQADAADTTSLAEKTFWVTAYYAAWMYDHLPPDQIDFGALTTVVNFSIFPNADGTFDTTSNGITAKETAALVKAAHQHGKQVLLGVGGSGTHDGFAKWMKPNKRKDFVKLVVKHVVDGDYDGVDLDMEPAYDSDATDFIPFVVDLRAALDAKDANLLLTAAVGWREALYAPIKMHFNRFGIMTYDLSGAWPGWETWHNSPLSNGGLAFASNQQPLPSCQTLVADALAAKAPLSKLAIGIAFYAYVWQGATGPNQPIQNVTVQPNLPYFQMMDTLYDPKVANWHAAAHAPYLSIGKGGQGQFVSYDDSASIAAKIAWAKGKGLGGVIIWELGGGFRPNKPAGKQDALLQAVKAAAFP